MGNAQGGGAAYDPRTPSFKAPAFQSAAAREQKQRRKHLPSPVKEPLSPAVKPVVLLQQQAAVPSTAPAAAPSAAPDLEDMLVELFRLHDLNENGFLEEEELVELNLVVGKLHYGDSVDGSEIEARYRALFREHLNATGAPVPYCVFRRYMVQVLNEFDRDPCAQEMIAEQLGAEARVARHLLTSEEPADQELRPPRCVIPDDVEEMLEGAIALECSPRSPRRQAARGGA